MSAKPSAIAAWEAADRRQDLGLMKVQLAPGVRLVSPLTDQFDFRGPDEVMARAASVLGLFPSSQLRSAERFIMPRLR